MGDFLGDLPVKGVADSPFLADGRVEPGTGENIADMLDVEPANFGDETLKAEVLKAEMKSKATILARYAREHGRLVDSSWFGSGIKGYEFVIPDNRNNRDAGYGPLMVGTYMALEVPISETDKEKLNQMAASDIKAAEREAEEIAKRWKASVKREQIEALDERVALSLTVVPPLPKTDFSVMLLALKEPFMGYKVDKGKK
jgi:hypothetical protein